MDGEYDCIILGTGLKECVISGLLSVEGKKVLHMDRNSYYGGDCASLNLSQLWEKFNGPDSQPPASLGHNRDYNVDLVPKFLMATGILTKLLLKTEVTRYLEFQSVQGGFVYKDSKIHKVPSTKSEAFSSSLMGIFEKRKCANLLGYIHAYNQDDEKTKDGFDATKQTMADLYKKFGVDENTQSFMGHALALYADDDYKGRPAIETIERILLYKDSILQYAAGSPFIYPRYGLGELPQAFARLAAIYGGTYMLNKPVDEIVYNEQGEAIGVKSEGEVAKAKFVVGDPSYFPNKTKVVGQVVRAICILNHPVDNTGKPPAHSFQIILPQKELSLKTKTNRKNDIYVACISGDHCVVPKGKYMAIVSTQVETANPEHELKPALDLLGAIEAKFVGVHDIHVPVDDGVATKTFISKSYDGTSHFESTSLDILDMYRRITGKDLDLTIVKKETPEEEQ